MSYSVQARPSSLISTFATSCPEPLGSASYAAGIAVAGVGDVNQDGIDDVLIGATLADPLTRSAAGTVYVIFGMRNGTAFSDLDLLTFTSGSAGFLVQGSAAFDNLGSSLSRAGDFNGDGAADFIVGAPGGDGLLRASRTWCSATATRLHSPRSTRRVSPPASAVS